MTERIQRIAELKDKIGLINPASYKNNVIVAGPFVINGVYIGAFLATATTLLISWTIRVISNKGFLPALRHWKFWLFNLIAAIAMYAANVQLDKWHGFDISWIYQKI